MFAKIATPPIPKRVFLLCKAVEKKPIDMASLKSKFEPPSFKGQSYFGEVRTAADELGLVSVVENTVSIATPKDALKDMISFRKYINSRLEIIRDGQFYKATREYMIHSREISELPKGERGTTSLSSILNGYNRELKLDENAVRGWRFWSSYLGFGYLQEEIYLLPNAGVFLGDIVFTMDWEKNHKYTLTEFINRLQPLCNILLSDVDGKEKQLNMAFSNGLRMLHDMGSITLIHEMDDKDIWSLSSMEAHPISGIVTGIIINEGRK